jgi:hypothetical protein
MIAVQPVDGAGLGLREILGRGRRAMRLPLPLVPVLA